MEHFIFLFFLNFQSWFRSSKVEQYHLVVSYFIMSSIRTGSTVIIYTLGTVSNSARPNQTPFIPIHFLANSSLRELETSLERRNHLLLRFFQLRNGTGSFPRRRGMSPRPVFRLTQRSPSPCFSIRQPERDFSFHKESGTQ